MSAPHLEATCTHLVTLVMEGNAWTATIYTVDERADLVDVHTAKGEVSPLGASTPAMRYKMARAHTEDRLADHLYQVDVTVHWSALEPLARNLTDGPGQRAAVSRLVDLLTGGLESMRGEGLPSDRSIPAVGLVNLTYWNGSRAVK